MVYEHNTMDEEIEQEKLKSLDEIKFLFEYEIRSRTWVSYVPFEWLQQIVANYYSTEVMRKWRKYKISKMMEDGKEDVNKYKRKG